MADEEDNPTTSSENKEKPAGKSKKSEGAEGEDEDEFDICEFLKAVYENRYYREIVGSTILFVVALKLAKECKNILIPMRYYSPFS